MTISIIADTVLKKTSSAGYPFRILGLLKGYFSNDVNVQLFLCNRNFTNTKEFFYLKELAKNTKIFLISPENFYSKRFLDKLLTEHGADIVQFENPEFVVNNAGFIQRNSKNQIFVLDLHDLYYKTSGKWQDYHLLAGALKLVDYVICLSREDKKMIENDFGKTRAKVLYSPLFIDCQQYKFYGPSLKANNLVFIGNFFHRPNLKAAEFLINKVCPTVKNKIKGFHINFLGLLPKQGLKGKSPFYVFHGFVKNRNSILRTTKLALAPIFDGYGSRVKLFEYAAFGLPVLATSKAFHGAENLKGIFLSDAQNFTNALIKLLADEEALLRAGIANRFSVEKYYNPVKVTKKLLSQIRKKSKGLELPKVKLSSKTYFPFWLREKRYQNNVLKHNYIISKNGVKII